MVVFASEQLCSCSEGLRRQEFAVSAECKRSKKQEAEARPSILCVCVDFLVC